MLRYNNNLLLEYLVNNINGKIYHPYTFEEIIWAERISRWNVSYEQHEALLSNAPLLVNIGWEIHYGYECEKCQWYGKTHFWPCDCFMSVGSGGGKKTEDKKNISNEETEADE